VYRQSLTWDKLVTVLLDVILQQEKNLLWPVVRR